MLALEFLSDFDKGEAFMNNYPTIYYNILVSHIIYLRREKCEILINF